MRVSRYPRKDSTMHKGAWLGAVFFILLLGLVVTPVAIKEVDQNRGKRAQKRAAMENEPKIAERAAIFTDYVFDDVKTYALQNMPSQREINSLSRFHDIGAGKANIDWLVQDSTKYANAIVRDVPFVVSNILCHYSDGNKYEPLYPVQHLDDVDSKTLCAVAMDFVNKSPKDLGTVARVKGLDVWHEIKRENPAYKMKINIKHLKEISKSLAYERALQAQAIKNAKNRGK